MAKNPSSMPPPMIQGRWGTMICSAISRSPYLRSVSRPAQGFDLLRDAVAVVGDDALDVGEPVLDRAQLGTQLRILGREQLDPLDRLLVMLGIDRLAPGAVEGVAVLDTQPGGEHPAADGDSDDHRDERENRLKDGNLFGIHWLPLPYGL